MITKADIIHTLLHDDKYPVSLLAYNIATDAYISNMLNLNEFVAKFLSRMNIWHHFDTFFAHNQIIKLIADPNIQKDYIYQLNKYSSSQWLRIKGDFFEAFVDNFLMPLCNTIQNFQDKTTVQT